ncbi:MAG: beta-lactamase family protein, partial [Proteobacteria bacterium]|nr:beta-lactamase family protein [Pseudomonadota bacterium]
MRLSHPLRAGILTSLLVGACLFALPAARAAAPAPAPADTLARTVGGTTFTVPKAWTAAIAGAVVRVSAPEADAAIAIVDVGAAADARAAAERAWAAMLPGTRRVPGLVSALPARDGWDERQVLSYDTPPNEHRLVQALALRHGANWVVVASDGSQGTFEKRIGAVVLLQQSVRPAGYQRESFANRPAHALDAARIEALRAFVRDSMRELGVPGASMALLDHGKLVYEGGFGVRELGRPEPVDAHTRFLVASNTKGMTTLLLARLVDEGKLGWDQPVTQLYPEFRLGSEETSRKVLVRHLVCACTGLPRKDLEWIFNTSPTSPATNTFALLAATEPTSAFGEVFQYNNLMASAAGYVAAHVLYPDLELGAAYDKAMQAKIFDPLGMDETTFDFARALAANHASGHAMGLDGQPAVAAMNLNYAAIPSRPAGGAWSSAHDMIKYVADELSLGVLPDGGRLVS